MAEGGTTEDIARGMVEAVLSRCEGAGTDHDDDALLDELSAIILRNGGDPSDDRTKRLLEQARIADALFRACRSSDAAGEAGDRRDAHLAEIARLRKASTDAATFLDFSFAAEALCKARSFTEFCALLPHVPLDRLHGSAFGKVSCFPLIWAMSARDKPLERVQLMVAARADIGLATRLGDTVLHEMAAMNRTAKVRLPILRFLVFRGADVEARNIHGQTPLRIALDRGSAEDVAHFLAVGARVSNGDLKTAARWPRKLRLLLDHLADDPDLPRRIGALGGWLRGEIAETRTYAEEAIADGATGEFHGRWIADLETSLGMISDLPGYAIPTGARKLEWKDEPAAFQSVKTAATLDEFRAALSRVDITTFSMGGDHPIYWPIRARSERLERLWLMLSAGASVKGAPGNGEALHIFAETRSKDADEQLAMARMLVQAGADLEALQYDGQTPLACAVAGRGIHETSALLQLGADPDVTLGWSTLRGGRFSAPLLFVAAEEARIFRLLLDHGADTGRRDSLGRELQTYLDEKIAEQDADIRTGDMSGNLRRHLNRSTRALSKSRSLLGET